MHVDGCIHAEAVTYFPIILYGNQVATTDSLPDDTHPRERDGRVTS